MAEAEEFGLKAVLEQLCSSRTLRYKPEPPLCLAVIGINRYLAEEGASQNYSYDVTVTDGKWRLKCRLSSVLHHALVTNAVRCGSCVSVSLFSFIYDERRFGQSYVCLEELDCEAEDGSIFSSIKSLDTLQWWRGDGVGSSMMWRIDGPLHSGRKHYLALWNNEDPQGEMWVPNTPPPDVVIDVSKICLLGDLDSFFRGNRRPLPLLVRVLHRSRLRYYGKPGQSIDFPFQAYFEVVDQSGVMSMVLWNDLCLEWYQRLTVGSVLYLQNFSLKKSYQNRSRPQISSLSLISFINIEITLNPRNPTAVVCVIPPKSVLPQWSLPDVTYNFCTRSEIESLSSNQACDVIGLVTYVSRVERIRNKGLPSPEKYWSHRWVHAVDGTSDLPFILEIFTTSQPEIFNNICPMTYLVCTQMRACREASSVYLTSSAETQLFITGCHKKQPYVSDPKVRAFIQWTKTLKDNVVLKKTSMGGHFPYPPPPLTFTPQSTTANNIANSPGSLSLIAVADLRREIDSFQYRECRRVAIQGHITAVQYHHWPHALKSAQCTAQTTQLDSGSEGVSGSSGASNPGVVEQSERSSVAPPTDSTAYSKRRRVEPGANTVQKQYWTRAKVHSEREQLQDENWSEEEESEEGYSNQSPMTQSPPTAVAGTSETESIPAIPPPSASWESSVWPLLKENVTDHLSYGSLHPESIPEKFRFDDRDILLHRINLSPSRWSPDTPLNIHMEKHTPVDCRGYFTLTLLGLNQQAAVDIHFIPVFSAEDPRAVGTPVVLHDNTLMSCISTGRIWIHSGTHFSPEALLSSAPALEKEKLVCLLDVCLLGQNKVEILCSKIYRTADITHV
ncbi:RPA-related protein RADX [Hoplias malabaricus]|uniref:RPA-related protein RADX n=1 Tax=Hoplias malabaricus TaxID=27720 RepID=UPI00346282A8